MKLVDDVTLIVNFTFVSMTGINMIHSTKNMKIINGKQKFLLVVSSSKIMLRRKSYGVLTLTNLSSLIV